MKKTLIAVMALAGLASADVDTPVLTLENVNLGQMLSESIDSELGLNTTTGVTAMITVNWTGISNAPMFWLGTDDGSAFSKSAATIGYRGNAGHASLFSTGGSNRDITESYNNSAEEIKTPDYISTNVGNAAKNSTHEDDILVYFMTTQDGVSSLYSVLDDADRTVLLLCRQSGMSTGDITGYHIGNWGNNAANSVIAQTGTATISLYSGVLTAEQMHELVPEPATATLSLLALAGLAARRRRH